MALEKIMWTVLPNGAEGRKLKFSLYLSPQLSANGHLGDFPNFKNWADRAASLKVSLEIAGLPSPLVADLNLDVPKPTIWDALLPAATTPVVAYAFKDQSSRTMRSFSVKSARQQVMGLYNSVANNSTLATHHPTLGSANPVSNFINNIGAPMGHFLETRQRALKNGGDPNNLLTDALSKELPPQLAPLYQAWRFYNRPQGTAGPGDIVGSPPIPDWDFHQVIAMLVDHGSLLRLLGLVIDGSVTVPDGIPIPPSSQIRVADVQFTNGGIAPDIGHPWTYFRHSASPTVGFLAAPGSSGEIGNGMLRLGDPKVFDVFEVDMDGAALKTLDFATNIDLFKRTTATQKADKPSSAALPALRTGGITVARIDRGDTVKAGFAVAKTRAGDPDNAQLYAEDITRGYRVDVLFRGRWYSLCQRVGQVVVGPPEGAIPIDVKDEGYVKGPSGSSSVKPGVTVDELYLHEAMFTWKGWSLVANRPGRTIPLLPKTTPERTVNKAGTQYQLVTDYHAAPKSLPRLRFGEPYRLRVRTVDLAGNSLPLHVTVPGAGWESPERMYLRYEPVATPTLVPRAMFREGEGLETLTIRTQVEHSHPHLPDAIFNKLNDRHVLPPKAAQLMAEEHAMLDGMFATDPGLAMRVSCKEQGTLLDRQIVDPYDTGFDPTVFPAKLVDVTDIALVDPTTVPPTEIPASDTAKWPVNRGDPLLVPSEYVIHKGTSVALPYLPDPLATGLALRFPDGTVQYQPFAGDWPDAKPFRLIMASGALDFVVLEDGSVQITLPPGTMLQLRYSSLIDASALDVMAFGQSLSDPLATQATLGQHWMLTPYRNLSLVHAVEQPIEDPKFMTLSPSKQLGKTYVQLRGRVHTHSQSTGEVDIMGRWTDPVDRVTDDSGPTTEDHDGFAFTRKIGYDETNALIPAGLDNGLLPRHEFGDTKHRLVKYRAIGTTRYREYFPTSVTEDKANISREGPEFGPLNVLSSARPDVPRVLYIVPTFRWDVSSDGLTSTRVGRGLRIYLDRPWYSSGAGELLGILLAQVPITPADMDPIRPYVSEWGVDPAGNNAPPTTELRATYFTNQAIPSLNNVATAEKPDLLVRVVAFNVEYNADRKLWFCDVEMNPGNYYYPFVRLAIARLQPDSVTGPEDVRLSRVVKTEFAQLAADRTATLNPTANGIDVTVSGLSAPNEVALTLPVPVPIPIPLPIPLPGGGGVLGAAAVINPGPGQGGGGIGGVGRPGGFKLNAAAGGGHVVNARLERRRGITRDDGKEALGWTLVGSEVNLLSYTRGAAAEVFWRGTVPWADHDPSYQYRLVIREFELYYTDPGLGVSNLPVYNPEGRPIGERLVYLDTIPLTP